jgi:hypothetical protein
MVFAIVILIFFGAIVFFHYIQGFFSAAISAILTVFAAVIAFSYHESLVPLLGGKMAEYSTPIILLALFGLSYLIMRLPFDRAIPGNIRLPLMVDKVGAVVMGLIAGVFASGIMAIAAQELPFTPEVGGFARFDTESERQQKVETKGRASYSKVWGELTDVTPGRFGDPDSEKGVPIIPVDNMTVALMSRLSSPTGSLQNDKPLESVHPRFLAEVFGQRLGIEASATHVASNVKGAPEQVKVLGVFEVNPNVPQNDADIFRKPITGLPIKPTGGEVFYAVRIMFAQTAADADSYVRFSPGSIRLFVYSPNADDEKKYMDYYPIGTMEGTGRIFVNKIDDFLFCKQGSGADLVFKLPKDVVDSKGAVKDGTFIEVKRNARVDLSGMKVEPLTANPEIAVLRKELVLHPELNGGQPLSAAAPSAAPAPSAPQGSTPPAGSTANKPAAGGGGAAAAPTANASVVVKSSNTIPVNVSLNGGQVPGGGFGKIDGGKVKNINMDASTLELKLGTKLETFEVPAGSAMIQVGIKPSGPQAWGFATDPEQYEIVDTGGTPHQPNGVVAIFRATTGERVMMRYIDSQTISGVAAPIGADAPTEAYLLYVVPANTTITEIGLHGQKSKIPNVVAK